MTINIHTEEPEALPGPEMPSELLKSCERQRTVRLARNFIFRRGHVHRYGGLGLSHIFLWDTTHPTTENKERSIVSVFTFQNYSQSKKTYHHHFQKQALFKHFKKLYVNGIFLNNFITENPFLKEKF